MSREMKNSGIKWIGEIPEEWEVMKIKHYCKIIFAGGTPQSNNEDYWDGDIPWIPSGSCKNGIIDSAPKHITKQGLENSSTKLIPSDTTVMAMTGATCSNVGYVTFDTCMNQSVVAYIEKKDKAQSKFLFYLLQGAQEEILIHKTGGAQSGINVEDCKNIIVPCINLSTQQRISDYLDKICGEIDGVIALQEKMIEELKAYKQSVITEAVTKGLNPNVPMRDSGIDWIGEIPEHWEIKRLKYLANIVRGGSPRPAGDERYYNGNIPFMKVADITKDENIFVHSCEYSIKETGLSNTRFVEANTLLLTNSGATLGVPKINSFPTTFNDGIAAFLNLSDKIDIIFAYYSLKARTKYFLESASLGIGQPNLNTDIIGNTMVLLPPISEQYSINLFLEEKCSEIDSLIAIKQKYWHVCNEKKSFFLTML